MVFAVVAFACQTQRSPTDQPGAAAATSAVASLALATASQATSAKPLSAVISTTSTSSPSNPFLHTSEVESSPGLPYESIAMDLPQPLLEPTPEQDPSQYEAANPAWPANFTEVYGSELVAKVKEAAKTKGTKGVLINAWASWCGPCKTEMPMLLKMREVYAKRGIDVWFVSVDKSDQAEQARAVLDERGVSAPHYVVKGRLGYFKEALSPIWKGSLPSTFLFDGQGRVRYYWGAHVYENELTPLLDDFLAGKSIDGMANFKVRRGPASISP
jgi:thiol-disulfide isomerase/thioredoxin